MKGQSRLFCRLSNTEDKPAISVGFLICGFLHTGSFSGLPKSDTQFKPGQSGNPSGKPRQLLTKDKVSSVLGRLAEYTIAHLEALIENPASPSLEVMIAALMVRAAKEGDPNRIEFVLQRSIGKVQDMTTIEVKKWSDDLKTIPIDTLKQLSKGSDE